MLLKLIPLILNGPKNREADSAHCNSGGSCGACSGRSAPAQTRTYNNTSRPLYSNPAPSRPSTPIEKTTSLKLVVTSTELNVRLGPGSEYQALETLTLGDQVNYISKKGEWISVKTYTGTKGYVHYKFVKFVE